MNLDQQIQALIDAAPPDGTTPDLVRSIAPALVALGSNLKHPQYYVLQTADQSWVMTTLSNRFQPNLEKRVIYAFSTLKDASVAPYTSKDPGVAAVAVPATHILFQMVAMSAVDSAVFFETSGDLTNGAEVSRQNLNQMIQVYLQKYQAEARLPPDIA